MTRFFVSVPATAAIAALCIGSSSFASNADSPPCPELGPEVATPAPDRAAVLSATQAARLHLSGVTLGVVVEEFFATQGDSPFRSWTETLTVLSDSAQLTQTYWMSPQAVDSPEGLTQTETFAFDGAQATHWHSSSREAVIVDGRAQLPRCLTELGFFSSWFPIPFNAQGAAAVDLCDVLSKPDMEFAPFRQSVDGAECLVLRSTGPLKTTIWIDPARGYFPRLRRIEDPSGVIAQWHLDAFYEVSADTWVPAGGTYWRRSEPSLAFPYDGACFRYLRLATLENGAPRASLGVPPIDPLSVPEHSTIVDSRANGN